MTAGPPKKGDRVSEYVLEERLGAGGFGEVWKAVHAHLRDEVVAIKIPTNPDFIENLRREGALLHALRGEPIVEIKGLDPYAEPPYLVMEYVEGKNLRQLLQDRRPLPVDDAVEIYRQALEGLRIAHGHGVIHRDMKPENILLDKAGRVKLTDFGLGRALEAAASAVLQSGDLRTAGNAGVAGTLRYMSPEQREGGPVDARTDLYSLAMVLFEMLVGDVPQGAELPSDANPDVPVWVDRVFARSYTRLERRCRDAAEALEILEKERPGAKEADVVFLGDVRVAPPPPLVIPPPTPPGRPRPLWLLPFFAVHAVFETFAAGLGGLIRGVRDGGGATAVSLGFLAVLALGGLLVLAGRAGTRRPGPVPAPAGPTRPAPARTDVRAAFADMRGFLEREDWERLWLGLSGRARLEIAQHTDYEGRDLMACREDRRWPLLEFAVAHYPADDPIPPVRDLFRALDGEIEGVLQDSSHRALLLTRGAHSWWVRESGRWRFDRLASIREVEQAKGKVRGADTGF